MTTFEGIPYKLVFFKKQECNPCKVTEEGLNAVLQQRPELGPIVHVMQKEYHSALVHSYDLQTYPTVLILDKNGDEVARRVGARLLPQEWWEKALTYIHDFRLRNNI
jgi:hypothetical protein